MLTGIRPKTFENLLLNEGIFLKNFDYSSATDLDSLITLIEAATEDQKLGATIGGGSFECTPEIRQIEVDGKRYEFVGSEVIDSWTVQLSATLKEVTAPNLKMAFATGEITTVSANKTKIQVRTDLEAGDYISNLIWIGSTSKGALLIDLKNALNTTGVTLTFEDKGESNIPVTFVAHQDSVEDMEYAPVTLYKFGGVSNPGISLDPKAATVKVGSTVSLTATKKPNTATVNWSSDDTDKATVSSGTVTGVAAGTVTITASITEDGVTYKDTSVVVVTPAT